MNTYLYHMWREVFSSWNVEYLSKEFFVSLIVLSTGVFGFFISLDLFTLFLFGVFLRFLLLSFRFSFISSHDYFSCFDLFSSLQHFLNPNQDLILFHNHPWFGSFFMNLPMCELCIPMIISPFLILK